MLDFAKELLAAFEKICRVSDFKVSTAAKNKWDTDRVIITGYLEDGRKMELILTEELPDELPDAD